jgi:hypothetical protein
VETGRKPPLAHRGCHCSYPLVAVAEDREQRGRVYGREGDGHRGSFCAWSLPLPRACSLPPRLHLTTAHGDCSPHRPWKQPRADLAPSAVEAPRSDVTQAAMEGPCAWTPPTSPYRSATQGWSRDWTLPLPRRPWR